MSILPPLMIIGITKPEKYGVGNDQQKKCFHSI